MDAVDQVRLRAWYDAASATITLELSSERGRLPDAFRLALTSIVQLTPVAGARLVSRLASYHELAPDPPAPSAPRTRWRIEAMTTSHPANHSNDGPVSAYLVQPDGATTPVKVEPMQRVGSTGQQRAPAAGRGAAIEDVPVIVPFPRALAVGRRRAPTATAHWGEGPDAAAAAWRSALAMQRRLDAPPALTAGHGATVVCSVGGGSNPADHRISIEDDVVAVTAADTQGFRYAFVTLAQLLAWGAGTGTRVADAPHWQWRALHVDLARQWFEPEVVARLIDLAAWRKFSHLHLHLTDDEGWRLPVPSQPGLARAARRGHGLTLPPMLGGGPAPLGRAYEPAEIDRWCRLADEVGIVLVPEVDLPGHAHAVLAALPELRDSDDASGAISVQYYRDNVLVPGLPATDRFVDDVLDAVTDLFPSSPYIHIGGDEVPDRAWTGSPVVAGHRRRHGLASTRDVEADFHRRVVAALRDRHQRRVGAWEEAAESGGVQPGDGYVVAWRTAEAARRLAAAGHDVVVSPGDVYYLDMAIDDRWETPGASWAGSTSLDDVCGFEPGAGWTSDELVHLLGVQACIWTEHVPDERRLHEMLFPRLDAIAERGWRGSIAGGPVSLRRRSERLRQSSP